MMTGEAPYLPSWIILCAKYSSILSSLIIFANIFMHLRNYRKPFQQRLMIRIQLIVPLFACSCYSMLSNPSSVLNKYVLESIREVYEAFVIYTFFTLLTDMLGGEKNIVILKSGSKPVSHPGVLRYIFPEADISDPYTLLAIKRGILQYVWLKPIICLSTILCEIFGWYDVNDLGITSIYLWLTILYNLSVTASLYCLAFFWKILWNDLKKFSPIGKFLCVKLIIFASYWQGVILSILSYAGLLPKLDNGDEKNTNIGIYIQNALLCTELVGFAIGHCFSFSYTPFKISAIPSGRVLFVYALKDICGIHDLVHDFKLTFYGDYYKDYKKFDSVEALIAHPDSSARMSRINQGLRYYSDGTQKHWLPNNHNFIQPQAKNSETNTFFLTSFFEDLHHETRSSQSVGTSLRGLHSASLAMAASPPGSPKTTESVNPQRVSLVEALNGDGFFYDNEYLDEDEVFYEKAASIINNYNLDSSEIRKLINYPISDDVVHAHVFGYKVKKLRKERLGNAETGDVGTSLHQGNYGTIV